MNGEAVLHNTDSVGVNRDKEYDVTLIFVSLGIISRMKEPSCINMNTYTLRAEELRSCTQCSVSDDLTVSIDETLT